MIKFLIDTVSSLTDINGNRYHFATVTSTKTGESVRIKNLGGERNAEHYVIELTGAEWAEIHSTHSDVAIRQFQRSRKFHKEGAKYEHELTTSDFERF